jgi:hypothetical protein
MITDGNTIPGILGFLMLAGGTILAAAAVLAAMLKGRTDLARLAGGLGIALWVGYVLLLAAVSLTSTERVLAVGQEKHLCEIDCHMAYTVVDVRSAKTWGGRSASGTFTIVTLRVRFDSATISSHRGMSPLTPGGRVVQVSDAEGRVFEPLLDAQAPPLTKALIPGESYTTTLVFDLPADVSDPRLLVAARSALPDRFVIGYENSFLHPKTTFRLT